MEQRTLIVTVQPDWRGRDVRRVQEDVTALADLGLLERTDRGGVVCPFADIIPRHGLFRLARMERDFGLVVRH